MMKRNIFVKILGSGIVLYTIQAGAQCTIPTQRPPYSLYLPSCSAADYDQASISNIVSNAQLLVNSDNASLQQADHARDDAHHRLEETQHHVQEMQDRIRDANNRLAQDRANFPGILRKETDDQAQIDQANQNLGSLQTKANEANSALAAVKPASDAAQATFNAANSQLTQLNQQVAQRQQALNQATTALNQATTAVNNSTNAVNAANNAISQANTSIAQNTAQISQDNAAIATENTTIANLRAQLAAAPVANKPAIQNQINAESAKVIGLQGNLNSSQIALGRAQASLNSAQASLNSAQGSLATEKSNQASAQSAVSAAQGALAAAQATVAPKQAEVNTDKAALDSANAATSQAQQAVNVALAALRAGQSDLATKRNTLAQDKVAEQNTSREIADIQGHQQEMDRELDHARNEAQDADRMRDLAEQSYTAWYNKYQYDSTVLNTDIARSRQVNAYVEQARQGIQVLAGGDGASDGGQELQAVASAAGTLAGTRSGQGQGTAAGIDRDYHTGMNQGIVQATADASNPAAISVTPDTVAYVAGKQQGYDSGYQTGANAAQVLSGQKNGISTAQQDADAKAQPQRIDAYSQEEQTYRQANLNKITLGDASVLSSGFKGTQGQHSNNGDDSHYNPAPPPTLPHQILVNYYMTYYDQAYRSTLDNQSAYNNVYSPAYSSAQNIAYNQALQAAHPQDQQRGYNQAYAGFTAGVAGGSYQKGYDSAYAATYDNYLAKRTADYRAIGKKQADDLYMNNPVIEIASMDVVDSDHDGINRPGETLQSVLVVRNFGMVAKSDLQIKSLVSNGPAKVLVPSASIPAVPGQSEATITAAKQIQISSSASEGSSVTVQYILGDSKTSRLSDVSIARQILFPTIVKTASFDGTLIPGVQTTVNVTLSNRSNSDQNLMINMSADPSKISIAQAAFTVGVIPAGTSKTVSFKLTGSPDAVFQQTPISISVSQNGQPFGQMSTMATIIAKHIATPASLGMIVSANLALGSGKSLYTLGKLDTWDLRVDGALTAAGLNDYTSKVVHLMADAQSVLDDSSLQALTAFVQKGGQVVVWGSDLDQSQMFAQLQPLSGVTSVSRAFGVNGTLQASNELNGISGTLSGQVESLAVNSKMAQVALVINDGSSIDPIGSVAPALGTDHVNQVGRVIVIASDAANVSQGVLTALTASVKSMAATFPQKLDNATQNSAAIPLLITDIYEEIMTAASKQQDFYSKGDKKSTKIFMTLDRMVNKAGGASHDEFARAYGMVHKALDSMVKNDSQLQRFADSVTYMMDSQSVKKSFLNYKTWKGLFCDIDKNNSNSPYCQSSNNNGNF